MRGEAGLGGGGSSAGSFFVSRRLEFGSRSRSRITACVLGTQILRGSPTSLIIYPSLYLIDLGVGCYVVKYIGGWGGGGSFIAKIAPNASFFRLYVFVGYGGKQEARGGGAVHCILNRGWGATFRCRPLSANAADKEDLRPRDGALLTFLLVVLCLTFRNSGCMSVHEASLAYF